MCREAQTVSSMFSHTRQKSAVRTDGRLECNISAVTLYHDADALCRLTLHRTHVNVYTDIMLHLRETTPPTPPPLLPTQPWSGVVQPCAAEPVAPQPIWLHLWLKLWPRDGELCLSCYLAVAAGEMRQLSHICPTAADLGGHSQERDIHHCDTVCCGEKRMVYVCVATITNAVLFQQLRSQ